MKQISLLFFSLLFCFILKAETTPATNYAGGSGTSADPYQIATLAQLRRLSETSSDWASYFILTASIDAADTKTWNSGGGLSPIGKYSHKFTGTFNGKGHTISNLYINRISDFVALFGYVHIGSIDSLGLINCYVSGTDYVGSLVGENYYSEISNSYSTGTVVGNSRVGGLVGDNYHSKVLNSYSAGNVGGTSNVGGLVGINSFISEIVTSWCSGSVFGLSNIGGLVGGNGSSTITNCYYNSETSGVNNGIGSDNNNQTATGLTTAQFTDASNFIGWDFTSTWKILVLASANSVKRPNLRWSYDHIVTFELGANGDSIAVADIQGVADGANALAVKAIGADGYVLKEWQNSTGYSITNDNPLIVTNVTQDSTLYAVFQIGYIVEFSADENGTIEGSSYQGVASGNNASVVTAVPNTGYHFDEWRSTAGDSITNQNPLIVSNVTQDSALTAVFEIDTYTVSFIADGNGTINTGASQNITYGSGATTVTATVVTAGYAFVEWQGKNGNTVSYDNPITLISVTCDTTLKAIFALRHEGGLGSSVNPYQIKTLAQLKTLSENSGDWSKSFVLTADIDAADTKTWNSGAGFSPIGDVISTGYRQQVPFTGAFDGNNHVISNLYINREEQLLGLFGRVESGAEIKNTGLVNVRISGTTNVVGNVGALIGYAQGNNGQIVVSNCFASGGNINGNNTLGGLIGTINKVTVTNCYATVSVSGYSRIGGFSGRVGTSSFTNCYAAGKCTGTEKVKGFYGSIDAYPTITSCYWDTITSGISSDCYNITPVSTTSFSDESTFTGWDFTSTWKVLALTSSDSVKRPHFQWTYDHVVTFELGENGDTIVGADIQGLDNNGSALKVTAVAKEGYQFKEWQDADGNIISTDNPFVLTNVTQDLTVTAVFEIGTGINTVSVISNLNIYPNPTTGLVNISLENKDGSVQLSIYSMTGELVFTNPAFNGSTVDLSGLNKGIYLVKGYSGKEILTTKLVKE